MSATPREIVYRTLEFDAPPRAARQLWLLPWAQRQFPDQVERIQRDFPPDIVGVAPRFSTPPLTQGDPFAVGQFVDEWGCVFTNVQEGIIGEVRQALVQDWQSDCPKVHFPREWLSFDRDDINRQCAASDHFMMAGACPRPFEQLQFLRTTTNLYMDLLDPSPAMLDFMRRMHEFYCELLEAWAKTDVDGLMFMDDWGSQRSLLISPDIWEELFAPMYRDYIQIAHAAAKKAFMHSDGHTLAIYPRLVELGLDAFNSQLFCMSLDELQKYAGKITFWGEIDRQHLLARATPEEIDRAVREVHARLWKNGGCIAQCEFGIGARPENVYQVFASWDEITASAIS